MDDARAWLAAEMDDRRQELRLRWRQVAALAGMTEQNLLRIRNGEVSITDFAAKGIERALEWPRGHVRELEAESDPTRAALLRLYPIYVKRYGSREAADQRLAQDVAEINEARARDDEAQSRSAERSESA